jgi:hypothetical protein
VLGELPQHALLLGHQLFDHLVEPIVVIVVQTQFLSQPLDERDDLFYHRNEFRDGDGKQADAARSGHEPSR